MEYAGGGDIL